jgi:hypothetical protein
MKAEGDRRAGGQREEMIDDLALQGIEFGCRT